MGVAGEIQSLATSRLKISIPAHKHHLLTRVAGNGWLTALDLWPNAEREPSASVNRKTNFAPETS